MPSLSDVCASVVRLLAPPHPLHPEQSWRVHLSLRVKKDPTETGTSLSGAPESRCQLKPPWPLFPSSRRKVTMSCPPSTPAPCSSRPSMLQEGDPLTATAVRHPPPFDREGLFRVPSGANRLQSRIGLRRLLQHPLSRDDACASILSDSNAEGRRGSFARRPGGLGVHEGGTQSLAGGRT